jgi:hypothetical protein
MRPPAGSSGAPARCTGGRGKLARSFHCSLRSPMSQRSSAPRCRFFCAQVMRLIGADYMVGGSRARTSGNVYSCRRERSSWRQGISRGSAGYWCRSSGLPAGNHIFPAAGMTRPCVTVRIGSRVAASLGGPGLEGEVSNVRYRIAVFGKPGPGMVTGPTEARPAGMGTDLLAIFRAARGLMREVLVLDGDVRCGESVADPARRRCCPVARPPGVLWVLGPGSGKAVTGWRIPSCA